MLIILGAALSKLLERSVFINKEDISNFDTSSLTLFLPYILLIGIET